MEVKKAYVLTKTAILNNLESTFVPSWDDVSSNHEKEYVLRKVIFNVKSNKTSFKEGNKKKNMNNDEVDTNVDNKKIVIYY